MSHLKVGVRGSTSGPMQTVVETPGYIKAAETILSEQERAEIVAMVAGNPDCGAR